MNENLECENCKKIKDLVLKIVSKNIKSNNRRKSDLYKPFKKNSCEICGYNKHKSILEVHHKDLNYKNNDKTNLITLCSNCHNEIHRCLH